MAFSKQRETHRKIFAHSEGVRVFFAPEMLLIGAVVSVGILHTIVPDHWVPITLLARAHRWSKRETALVALKAGTGHVVSTLVIGLCVWLAGVAFAKKFGNIVSLVSSGALIAFGAYIAVASLREMHRAGHHGHDHPHSHGHDHAHDHSHAEPGEKPPRPWSRQTALLLILGSSPMVEGIPAFFAAAKYGPLLILAMTIAFAVSTIATYVALCVGSLSGLRRLNLGHLENYGEVLSGAFIALVGVVFLIFPVL